VGGKSKGVCMQKKKPKKKKPKEKKRKKREW
jgi:hypothetical protein